MEKAERADSVSHLLYISFEKGNKAVGRRFFHEKKFSYTITKKWKPKWEIEKMFLLKKNFENSNSERLQVRERKGEKISKEERQERNI